MRRILAFGPLLALAGACFEDASPVDETGGTQSTGEQCVAGTEGCPCIDGQCVGGLECFSNVCVDAGSTSTSTTTEEPETSTSTSTTGPTSVSTTLPPMTSSDSLDTGPVTSDVSSGLPPGSPCDPLFDLCDAGLACVDVMDGFYCDEPGMSGQGDSCGQDPCGPGLACVAITELSQCMSMLGCCTTLCDLAGGNECPMGLACAPFYAMGEAPPGYEHIGACVG